MTQNASKQGKLDSFGAIFLFIFLPCMWGLGLQNDSPSFFFEGRSQFCGLSREHSRGHFWECPNSTLKALAGVLLGTPHEALLYIAGGSQGFGYFSSISGSFLGL